MLTDNELDSMRAVAERALPGTAIIQTNTFTSDGGGGGSVGWAASGTVDCRIAPLSGDERTIGGRVTAEADSIVTLPFGTDIAEDARLVIDGTTYNVQAIRERSYEVTTRVEVARET